MHIKHYYFTFFTNDTFSGIRPLDVTDWVPVRVPLQAYSGQMQETQKQSFRQQRSDSIRIGQARRVSTMDTTESGERVQRTSIVETLDSSDGNMMTARSTRSTRSNRMMGKAGLEPAASKHDSARIKPVRQHFPTLQSISYKDIIQLRRKRQQPTDHAVITILPRMESRTQLSALQTTNPTNAIPSTLASSNMNPIRLSSSHHSQLNSATTPIHALPSRLTTPVSTARKTPATQATLTVPSSQKAYDGTSRRGTIFSMKSNPPILSLDRTLVSIEQKYWGMLEKAFEKVCSV